MKVLKEYVIPVIITFGITVIFCVALLYATGLIPKSRIQENIKQSAEYLKGEALFPYLSEERFHTNQDNYADTILVNIVYHVDRENLFSSLMEASYYKEEGENVHISLWDAMKEPKEANIGYERYWHGAMVLLRPLFLFLELRGIRMLLGILVLFLAMLISLLLYWRKEKALALCYLIAHLFVQAWMCAFCIEYVTTFLVMNAVVLCVLLLYRKETGKLWERNMMLLMCISGTVTCFLDFLTTETLTVTVPLFIYLVFRYRDGKLEKVQKEITGLAGYCLVWGISYGTMFLSKWGLSSLVLGKNVFQSALSSVEERTLGEVSIGSSGLEPAAGTVQKLMGALGRNQGMLFPFREEMSMGAAFAAFFGICFLGFAIIYMFHGKNLCFRMIFLCLLLALVPYVRYLVLSNHSYIHYFFTYRAQLVTVLALLFCSWEFGVSNLFIKRK